MLMWFFVHKPICATLLNLVPRHVSRLYFVVGDLSHKSYVGSVESKML